MTGSLAIDEVAADGSRLRNGKYPSFGQNYFWFPLVGSLGMAWLMENPPKPHFIDPVNLEQVYQRRLKFIDEAYGHATAYDTAIMVAGYGAFFALWAGVADDIESTARGTSVALMGVSLLIYIGWTIANMLTRHRFDSEFAATMSRDSGLLDEMNAWDAVEIKKMKGIARLQRWWPAVFYLSVFSGVGGALTLIAAALTIALF